MSEWQPIETAPSDSAMLVFSRSPIGRRPNHWVMTVARNDPRYGWQTIHGKYSVHPTHWMQLPDPPVDAVAAPVEEATPPQFAHKESK
jgi:hypothetical protein